MGLRNYIGPKGGKCSQESEDDGDYCSSHSFGTALKVVKVPTFKAVYNRKLDYNEKIEKLIAIIDKEQIKLSEITYCRFPEVINHFSQEEIFETMVSHPSFCSEFDVDPDVFITYLPKLHMSQYEIVLNIFREFFPDGVPESVKDLKICQEYNLEVETKKNTDESKLYLFYFEIFDDDKNETFTIITHNYQRAYELLVQQKNFIQLMKMRSEDAEPFSFDNPEEGRMLIRRVTKDLVLMNN
jgi:hypothetical protein